MIVLLSLVQLQSSFHVLAVALVTFLQAHEALGQTASTLGGTQQEQFKKLVPLILTVLHPVHCWFIKLTLRTDVAFSEQLHSSLEVALTPVPFVTFLQTHVWLAQLG